MLNDGKTELLILYSKHRPQPSLESVVVADLPVVPTQSARNLGVVFDNEMNFEKHISEICKSAFFHIRNISQVRRYLSIESTKTLIHAFVTSRIDNCNALLYGLPSYLVQRLQYVLNSAARLIFLSRNANHITPLLIDLHWLPVEQRINFKIMLLTYNRINWDRQLTQARNSIISTRPIWRIVRHLRETGTNRKFTATDWRTDTRSHITATHQKCRAHQKR